MAQKISFNEIYDIQEVEERLEQYSSNNWNSNMYIKQVKSDDESENLEQTIISDLRKETPLNLRKKNFSLDSTCNLIESKEQSQFLQRHLIKSVLNKNNNNI